MWGEAIAEDIRLRLESVGFSYDGKRRVLENVNMDFLNPGMTSIVGESGCGKSTVVNLLTGALRPDDGRVTSGGRQISELSREEIGRAHV